MVLETVLFHEALITALDVSVILIARDQKIHMSTEEAIIATRGKSRSYNLSALVDVVRLI